MVQLIDPINDIVKIGDTLLNNILGDTLLANTFLKEEILERECKRAKEI